jgi:hypothetical protein
VEQYGGEGLCHWGARFSVECKGEWQPLRLAQGVS